MTTPGQWAVLLIKNKTLIVSPHVGQVAALNGASPDDAALMASAPALLAALKGIMEGVAGCQKEPQYEAARAAISQAQQGHNV